MRSAGLKNCTCRQLSGKARDILISPISGRSKAFTNARRTRRCRQSSRPTTRARLIRLPAAAWTTGAASSEPNCRRSNGTFFTRTQILRLGQLLPKCLNPFHDRDRHQFHLLPPEVLEPVRRQGRIDRRRRDRPMPQPTLNRPCLVPLVGEGAAAGVAKHVRMSLQLKAKTKRAAG